MNLFFDALNAALDHNPATPVIHWNDAPRYHETCPEWINAEFPACMSDGDAPTDCYTVDGAAVTCPDCRAELRRREAGEAALRG